MERAMFEITEGLNAQNIECNVLCSNTKPVNEESFFENYTVFRTASYGVVNSASVTPNLIRKLWQLSEKYDIIHVHHPDPTAFLALFLVRPSSKIIIHWQSDIVRQATMIKYFMPLQNWVLKRADAIIVATQEYADHSEHLQPFKEKIAIVPIGISSSAFQTDQAKIDAIKERYKDKKIILAFGRLVTYKGFDILIESAQYLSDDCVVLIGGGGHEAENLSNLIRHYQLENRVILLGHIPEEEKYNYFEAATLFCLPSVTKAEAYGVVLLEAMAFGKPIVSSKIIESGMSWVNQDNITGIQVDPKAPRELASAIRRICDDPELYETFSTNALQRYQNVFTRESMIDALIRLYRKVLKSA